MKFVVKFAVMSSAERIRIRHSSAMVQTRPLVNSLSGEPARQCHYKVSSDPT
jgi:hypothetical protein